MKEDSLLRGSFSMRGEGKKEGGGNNECWAERLIHLIYIQFPLLKSGFISLLILNSTKNEDTLRNIYL